MPCRWTPRCFLTTPAGKRRLAVPKADALALLDMPCLDAVESNYEQLIPEAADWWVTDASARATCAA
jgi:DEAD/DEAH box helicase domain-containing protein